MDHIMTQMIRLTELIFEVNRLTSKINSNRDLSFIDGAEQGLDVSKYGLTKEEDVELYEKRSQAFELTNEIMGIIQDMSSEEKIELDKQMLKAAERSNEAYVENFNSYQKIIQRISQPDFPREELEKVKPLIAQFKENTARFEEALRYYNNMHNYLKVSLRKK